MCWGCWLSSHVVQTTICPKANASNPGPFDGWLPSHFLSLLYYFFFICYIFKEKKIQEIKTNVTEVQTFNFHLTFNYDSEIWQPFRYYSHFL